MKRRTPLDRLAASAATVFNVPIGFLLIRRAGAWELAGRHGVAPNADLGPAASDASFDRRAPALLDARALDSTMGSAAGSADRWLHGASHVALHPVPLPSRAAPPSGAEGPLKDGQLWPRKRVAQRGDQKDPPAIEKAFLGVAGPNSLSTPERLAPLAALARDLLGAAVRAGARPASTSPKESSSDPRASAATTHRHETGAFEAPEARLASIVNAAQSAIIRKTLDGEIVSWNPAAEALYGYAAEEAIGQPIRLIVPEDRHEELGGILLRIGQGQQVGPLETMRRRKDGTRVTVELTVSPIQDAEGRLLGASAVARDVTREKADRQQLELLETAVDQAREAIILLEAKPEDGQGRRIQYVNAAFEAMTGYQAQEVVGGSLQVLKGPKTDPDALQRIADAFENQAPVEERLLNYRKDGTPFWAAVAIAPVRDAEGRHTHWVSIQREITAQKEVEDQLRASEARNRRLAAVAARTTNGVVITDAAGRVEWINEGYRRMTGYSLDELQGKTPGSVMQGPDTDPEVVAYMRECLQAGRGFDVELLNYHKDGRSFWVRLNVEPLHENGETTGYIAIESDVTERRRTVEALKESEARYRALTRSYPQGAIVLFDHDLRYLLVGGEDLSTVNLDSEDMEGKTIWEVFPEAICAQIEPDYRAALRGERVINKVPYADQVYLTHTVPVRDENGDIFAGMVITENITNQEAAREALEVSEEKYRLLAEHTGDVIILLDADLNTEYVSPSVERMLGYAPETFAEMTAEEMLTPASAKKARRTHDERVERRAADADWTYTSQMELEYVRKDGTTLWAEQRTRPVLDEDGAVRGYLATARDISDRKAFERQLIAAKEEAEEMSQLKSAFLANMSHEIRTPLTSIIGFSDLLHQEVDSKNRQFVALIRRASTRLHRMLNSVLDLAQLESQTVGLSPAPLDLNTLVKETVELFRQQAESGGIELHYNGLERPYPTSADRTALVRILNNLVSNAVKFTHEGCVEVALRALDGAVELEVADTGIGIGSSFLEVMYEEFQQESSGMGRHYEGAGLGLSITKQLVELMEGTIAVDSVKGEGSIFTVRLPLAADDERVSPAPPARPVPETDGRILVVDARPETRDVTRRLVQAVAGGGATVAAVSTPAEALSRLSKAPFDLVLIDTNAEDPSRSVRLVNAIRARPELEAVPLIASTGYALSKQRQTLLDVGFDAYVVRPFTRKALAQMLADQMPV